MIMKAFIYNIFIAQIRGLPREAGRGRDRWAARRGVVQHSKIFANFLSFLSWKPFSKRRTTFVLLFLNSIS